MRVVIHEYAEGGRTAYELSNDGGEFVREWDGERKVGNRICAFIDVGCDDTDAGVKRLLDTMTWLMEEIEKRKLSGQPAGSATANAQPTNPAA